MTLQCVFLLLLPLFSQSNFYAYCRFMINLPTLTVIAGARSCNLYMTLLSSDLVNRLPVLYITWGLV